MENLLARTEINEALTNIVLVNAFLNAGMYREAETARLDAEQHYRLARSAVTSQKSGPVLDSLADLRIKLDQLRSATAGGNPATKRAAMAS